MKRLNMGFLVIFLWIFSATASPSIGWTDLRPGGSRSMLIDAEKSGWTLKVQDSELAPVLKGVGTFSNKQTLGPLKKRMLDLDTKLKARAQLLGDLPVKKDHAIYGRLNDHVVDLNTPFGVELRGILDDFFKASWQPIDGHTVIDGKIQKWVEGKAVQRVLPAQTLECRWDSTAWLCEYPQGLLQFSKVTP